MRFVINPFTELLDVASLTGSGSPPVEFIAGNSGGAVGPDPTTFTLNLLGDHTTGLNVVGNPGTFTLTIFGLASSTTQIGTTRYATNAEAAAQTIGTAALTPSNITSLFSTNPLPASQGGTGLSSPAAHQLMVTEGSSAFTLLGVASNGQIPIGSIGSDPVLANITSTGGTISVTNGPGTINIEASGTGDVQTLTGNTGGVVNPTAGNINTVGTGSITIAGSGSTLTTQLTGLTNHNVLIGAGTATITKVAPSATSGVPLISQGAAADPLFGTAVVAGGGTGAVSLTAHSLLLGQGTSPITALGAATNGQLPIGSTGADPVLANITSSGGTITVSNGAGTINIDLAGGGLAVDSFSPDSGTDPVVPTAAGLVNDKGSGSITTVGSLNTITTQLTGLTNHNVLVGAGTTTITKVAPSATSGVPLISQGASADPTFGTAVVAGGGTGATSFNINGPVISGTSTTSALAAVTLASQQFLVGNAAAPTAKTLSVVIQTFTSSGTYTPTTGMVYCITEAVGSGGGGGGTATSTASFICGGGGGGGGGYARKISTAAAIGASQTVTIGAAGSAGSAGNNAGGNGADCSLGSICIAKGGQGGNGNAGGSGAVNGGPGGVAGTGDFTFPGEAGSGTFVCGTATATTLTARGGNSHFGPGGSGLVAVSGQITGNVGGLYGGGGGGACSVNNAGSAAGAIGAKGVVIVTEFVLA